MPPDGRIYILSLWPLPAENGGGGLSEAWTSGTGEMKWPTSPSGFPLNAYRCQLTNYGGSPVFNVEMALHLLFSEALRDTAQPNVTRGGVVTLSRNWPIEITKIDAGADKPFVFYIYNQSDQFSQVSMPQSVTVEEGTDNTRREIRLVQSTAPMFHLPPFEAKQ